MSDKSSGVIMGIITTISFGIIGTTILSVILGVDAKFDLSEMYAIMSLDSTSKIANYTVILLSWALGGLIAGVRTKNSYKGFLSGFFGAFIGGLMILLLYVFSLSETLLQDVDLLLSTMTPFAIGMIGIMLAASLIGFGSGKASYQPTKAKPKAKSKIKTWSDKNKWNCTKCGKNIPPGKMNCPNCGAGVIQ